MLEQIVHEPLEGGGQGRYLVPQLEAVQESGSAAEEGFHDALEVDIVQAGRGAEVALVVADGGLAHGGEQLGLVHVLGVSVLTLTLAALVRVGPDFDTTEDQVLVEHVAAFGSEFAGPFEACDGCEDAVDECDVSGEEWLVGSGVLECLWEGL